MARETTMTKLAKAAAEYVALRRALGFKMVEVSHRLADFVKFAQRERASHVTVDLAVRWAKLPTSPAGHVGNPIGNRPAIY